MSLLYTIGNLYTGYPYGVEAKKEFGSVELHGPFSTENEANTYAHRLIEPRYGETPYLSVKVVKIETPQAGIRIVLNNKGAYEYAERAV
jgi:hypothetical protein